MSTTKDDANDQTDPANFEGAGGEQETTQTPADAGEGVLAAIEAGIAESTGEPAQPGDDAGTAAETKTGDDAAAASTGDDAAAGEGEDAGGEGGGAEASGDSAAAAAAGEPSGQKLIDDPIPEGLRKETRERMTGLVDIARTLTKERDELRSEHAELHNLIVGTGATPEQFGRTMELLANSVSDDPSAKRQALEALQSRAKELATELGEPIAGDDPLERHDDLREDVRTGSISRKHARELAAKRDRDAALEQRRQEQAAQQEQQQQVSQAQAKVKQDINAFEEEMRARDPDYPAKRPELVRQVRRLAKYTPPDRLLQAVREVYADITPAPSATAAPANGAAGNGGGTSPQPQRPGRTPQGGKQREVGSPAEAIELGIQQAAQQR